ncbi:MAG: hypothetical protein IBX39_08415 [Candidatus Methanoperedenaceae archaeon]|nr:hypothetical protein [Candidatus Methanoperedenaceae archaeon]
MKITEILKNSSYAIIFGFFGLIIGIWTADVIYMIALGNIDRETTRYVSLAIILLVIAASALIGFTRGKNLLESDTANSGQ